MGPGGQGPRLHCSPALVHPFLCPPQHMHPCLGRGRWNVLEGTHFPAPLSKALFIPAVFLGLGFPHHPPDSGKFTLCRASGRDPVMGEGGAEKQTSRLEQRWGGGPDCRTQRGARPGERQPFHPLPPPLKIQPHEELKSPRQSDWGSGHPEEAEGRKTTCDLGTVDTCPFHTGKLPGGGGKKRRGEWEPILWGRGREVERKWK